MTNAVRRRGRNVRRIAMCFQMLQPIALSGYIRWSGVGQLHPSSLAIFP
jgi:hypothetical protein